MRVRSIKERSLAPADPGSAPTPEANGILPASLSEAEAARYIGMSAAWLKKSRTRRFRGISDAPPFVRAGARRIVYRRCDLEEWQRRRTIHVGSGGP